MITFQLHVPPCLKIQCRSSSATLQTQLFILDVVTYKVSSVGHLAFLKCDEHIHVHTYMYMILIQSLTLMLFNKFGRYLICPAGWPLGNPSLMLIGSRFLVNQSLSCRQNLQWFTWRRFVWFVYYIRMSSSIVYVCMSLCLCSCSALTVTLKGIWRLPKQPIVLVVQKNYSMCVLALLRFYRVNWRENCQLSSNQNNITRGNGAKLSKNWLLIGKKNKYGCF